MGADHIIVVAGGVIPQKDYSYILEETRSARAIFGPGTRLLDAAKEVLSLIKRQG